MTRPYLSADERRKQALQLITADGISSKQLAAAMGYAKSENAVRIVDALVFAGMVQTCRVRATDDPTTRSWVTMYFQTIEARDAFIARRAEQSAARRRQRKMATAKRMPYYVKRDAQRKEARAAREKEREERKQMERAQAQALRAAEAEQRKLRARLDREAKAAEKAREKAEAKTLRERLRAETKAAGQMTKQRGTASPPVAKPKGPAHLDGELDLSRAKVTVAPPLPDRWASAKPAAIVSSRECRLWAKKVAA